MARCLASSLSGGMASLASSTASLNLTAAAEWSSTMRWAKAFTGPALLRSSASLLLSISNMLPKAACATNVAVGATGALACLVAGSAARTGVKAGADDGESDNDGEAEHADLQGWRNNVRCCHGFPMVGLSGA